MTRQAVILVGAGEAGQTPVALREVAGRPFLDYILDELSRYPTVQDIVLVVSHQAAARYDGGRRRGAAISVVLAPESSGSGGALFQAGARLDDRFLLLDGASFHDFNLLDLASLAHPQSVARVALTRERAGDHHERVVLDGDLVTQFLPAGTPSNGPFISGVCWLHREVLSFIGEGPCSLGQHIFPRLVEQRQLRAATYDGFSVDIGAPSDLARAQLELPGRLHRPAVFFDRDGVLNVDRDYVHKVEDFEWVAGARDAIKLCNDRGYLTFVVTNQSGVARGYYGIDAVHTLHDWMSRDLAGIGAHIDDYQYCPYHEEGVVPEWRQASDRRKPAPGMILDCLRDWPVRKESSLLIGDRPRDLQAAVAAGIPGHLFTGGNLLAFMEPLIHGSHA